MSGFKIIGFTPAQHENEQSLVIGYISRVETKTIIFRDIVVRRRNGILYAAPPSRPVLGPDGKQLFDQETGKPMRSALISFPTPALRDAFSESVIRALLLVHPELGR
jgi:hypothetical protein